MPKKLSKTESWPTLVQERLCIWGKCIRMQRMQQRMTVLDFSTRLGVSRATLLRLEKGDPGAGTGAYLTAFLILGLFDEAVPALPGQLWQGDPGQRVRLSQVERGSDDDDYF